MLYLTADQPGIGGRLKVEPEDFFVEEIPLYLPKGEGQHVYVEIEKRQLPTYAAIKMIARALNISPRSIGHAGLKDAQAITRQTLSIAQVTPEAVQALQLPNIQIRKVTRHHNKLRIGHLVGNRFIIRVREVTKEALPITRSVLEILAQKGVPNFFGEQRFGMRDNNHRLGEMLIRGNAAEFVTEYLGRPQPHEALPVQAARHLVDSGQWTQALARWPNSLREERRVLAAVVQTEGQVDVAFRALDRKLKSLFVSAFQSHLFNQLLRYRFNTMDQVQFGDVAYIHSKGAAFVVHDAVAEQVRVDRFEISPAGPLFGPKLLMAQGQPGEQEQMVLAQSGLSIEDFKVPGLKIRGVRRPYRIKLNKPQCWWDEGLIISFELPSGAYATTVMREIMKN